MDRVAIRLALAGLLGAASMLLAPIEQIVPTAMSPAGVRLLAALQPAILVLLATALGAWAAPRAKLDSPAVRASVEGRPVWPILRAQAAAAIPAGLAVGLLLVGFGELLMRADLPDSITAFPMPLATKMLYGGIVEELLLRWGVMSFLVWAAWRAAGRREQVPAWCYWAGIGLAALLFAAGHLPMLFLLISDPPSWLVAAVIAGNAVPGLLFGWLYWRRGLEAAMLAHALAHLFGTIGAAIS